MASEEIHIIASDQEPMQNGDITIPVPNGPPNREPKIPGFRIIKGISEHTGQGDVYLAEQLNENGLIRAIKVLQSTSPEYEEQIEREIDLLRKINHPAFVAFVLHGRTEDGRIFFAMEYFPGEPFSIATLRQWNFGFRQTLEAFYRICLAVQAMHSEGITHKDLKPGNILIDEFGTIKVIDLGLAGILALTNRGYAEYQPGTPAYMSPEQAEAGSRKIDKPSDVYTLGVILYHVLSGAFPYEKTSDLELLLSRIRKDVPPRLRRLWLHGSGVPHDPKNPDNRRCPIDRRLERIVHHCLEKKPGDRYPDAGALAHDVRRFLDEQPLALGMRNPVDDGIILNYRTFARRHHMTNFTLLVVLVCVLGGFIGVPLVYSTPLNTHFVRWITGWGRGSRTADPLDSVMVIGRTEQTDFEALAGVYGISLLPNDDAGNRRLVYGQLMNKLAQSQCRVVVFDLGFQGETGGDESFAAGVRALSEHEIDVVVGTGGWQLEKNPLESFSKSIVDAGIRGGSPVGDCDDSSLLVFQAFSQRQENDPHISLALAAFAADLHQGVDYQLQVDSTDEAVRIVFRGGGSEPIRLTRIETVDITEEDVRGSSPQLKYRDKVGVCALPVFPTSEELSAITIPLEQALVNSDGNKTTTDQFRQWFLGKTVLIGDLRPNAPDIAECKYSNELIKGCYLNAAAIGCLRHRLVVREPTWLGERVLATLGAACGCLVGWASPFVTRRRVMALIGLTVASFIASVAAYNDSLYLFNPLFPLVMVLLGAEGTAALRRATAGGPDPI